MVSPTSARVYNQHVKGPVANNQNKIVLDFMRTLDGPCSIRYLLGLMQSRGNKIDLSCLRRCLTDLTKPNPKGKWLNEWGRAKTRIAYQKQCPVSKKRVGWYEPIEKVEQLKIFN